MARLVAATAHSETGAHTTTATRLASSSTSGTKTDIVVESFELDPPITTIDVTISCSLLPSYVAAAARDSSAIFTTRATEKEGKHLPGCIDAGRAYLSLVGTTLLSFGPAAAREWLDSLFRPSYARELASGGTGYLTTRRRLDFLHRLQSTLVRTTSTMITTHTPTPSPTPQPPPPAPSPLPPRPT